jgi:hypothetical protein
MRFAPPAITRSLAVAWLLGLAAVSGCARWTQPPPPPLENPLAIPAPQCDAVWDEIVDVVDDYFDIQSEQRVRQAGDVLTVGRIDTAPRTGATLLEPWRTDAVNGYERLHDTLQTIRRRAVVQVIPAGNFFQVEAIVYKELEDLPTAEFSTAGQATFRPDDGLVRLEEPVGVQSVTAGWIALGRDTALEQEMLAKIMARVGPPQVSGMIPAWAYPNNWAQPWTSGLAPVEVVPSPPGESVPAVEMPTTIP